MSTPNRGRGPLGGAGVEAGNQGAQGYSHLELDLSTGRRGSREAKLQSLLRQLTGAEAALAVNNNASAMLLGLSALAAGKEVVVSRSEAVEIGGGFRVPDVLRQSGRTLIDVGPTHRPYLSDYAQAVTENTAASLKVHARTFRTEGSTAPLVSTDRAGVGWRLWVGVLGRTGLAWPWCCRRSALAWRLDERACLVRLRLGAVDSRPVMMHGGSLGRNLRPKLP